MEAPKQSFLSPYRWLITGGCGFIGLNLIKHLVKEGGHYIRIVDNLSVGTLDDLTHVCEFSELHPAKLSSMSSDNHPESDVEIIVGDILDSELAEKIGQGIDVVVHLAANTGVGPSVEDPRADCMSNIVGTLNYLESARHNGVSRFIFASSGAPLGECEPPIHEELAPHPVSPYGASKLGGEAYCSAYYRTYGINTVALRFGNVFGPLSNKKNSVVAKFIKRAIQGKSLEIYGDGFQTRDFIYIEDLIEAVLLSVTTSGIAGETYQIATNAETTIAELVEKLKPILSNVGYSDIKIIHAAKKVGDVARNYSDTSKAKLFLNWNSKVELREGLRRTVEWFCKGNQ